MLRQLSCSNSESRLSRDGWLQSATASKTQDSAVIIRLLTKEGRLRNEKAEVKYLTFAERIPVKPMTISKSEGALSQSKRNWLRDFRGAGFVGPAAGLLSE